MPQAHISSLADGSGGADNETSSRASYKKYLPDQYTQAHDDDVVGGNSAVDVTLVGFDCARTNMNLFDKTFRYV